jgi:hypothetical protein
MTPSLQAPPCIHLLINCSQSDRCAEGGFHSTWSFCPSHLLGLSIGWVGILCCHPRSFTSSKPSSTSGSPERKGISPQTCRSQTLETFVFTFFGMSLNIDPARICVDSYDMQLELCRRSTVRTIKRTQHSSRIP